MDKYVCDVCGYVYDPAVGDPDNGIDPGTSFDQLPEDWVCPLFGVALIYLVLVMIFTWLLAKFERRLAQSDR